MLQFNALSPAQRRWVELVELYFPNTGKTISYAELKKIDGFFRGKRQDDPRFKVSKPLWLITHNAIERGVYLFPASGVKIAETLTDREAEYRAELAKFSIAV